jgi:hypothetical protein
MATLSRRHGIKRAAGASPTSRREGGPPAVEKCCSVTWTQAWIAMQ